MGKSFVLSVFKELGAEVLDSDEIVHHLLQDKKVISKVKKILGGQAENEHGALVKKEIARLIFNNNELRDKLEAMLHPLVFHEVQNHLRKIKGSSELLSLKFPSYLKADIREGLIER